MGHWLGVLSEFYKATLWCVWIGRGTGARAEFENVLTKQLGILRNQGPDWNNKIPWKTSYIDKDRIGIWGWSFGGSTYIYGRWVQAKNIFKAGIAVAPVTDWRLYNTAYTERFMRRPQENFDGYDKTSALGMANKLNNKPG